MRRSYVCLIVVLALAACRQSGGAPDPSKEPLEAAPESILEFAIVVQETSTDPGLHTTAPAEGQGRPAGIESLPMRAWTDVEGKWTRSLVDVRVEQRRRFHIVEATPDHDQLGYPAVRIRVDPREKLEFEEWTRAHIDRQLAVIVDGLVVTTPRIAGALPGSAVISFGISEPLEEDEARDLARSIVAQH